MRIITGRAININERGSGGLRKADKATVTNQISLLLDETAARLTNSVRRRAKITNGVWKTRTLAPVNETINPAHASNCHVVVNPTYWASEVRYSNSIGTTNSNE